MSQAQQETEMDCPPNSAAKCPHCNKIFPSETAMVEHMDLEYRQSGWQTHIHCQICKKYFKSHNAMDAHSKRNHQKDQKLDCPACNKHFVRATDMVRHIEQKQCPRIDIKKLEMVREQKLWFARELQARHLGDYDEEAEAAYMSRNAALRPKAEATVRPYPVQFEVFESDNLDVYAYYQNVLQANRTAESSTATKAIEDLPQASQLPTREQSQPIGTEKGQQDIPKTAASLLDDFDPAEIAKLQPFLIDWDQASGDPSGPWSVFFNPWENDDLIGLSTQAASRATSSVQSQMSTPRARSPAPTAADSERTIDVALESPSQIASSTAKSTPSVTANTAQTLAPGKSYGGRVNHAYNIHTVVPLGNYKTLPSAKSSESAIPHSHDNLAPVTTKVSQALTPIRGPGALVSPQVGSEPPMADFDAVKKSVTDFVARHDPRNPGFRAEDYFNNLIGKYKCPMPQCFKSFKKPGQFKHHLGTHMQEKKCMYPCPGCKDMFETIASLIAHTESQSIRCRFRHSKNYGTFLSQALAGIVDVVGEDLEHGTVEFAISKEAKETFGATTPGNDTRRSRPNEFKAATAALAERAEDEREEKRKFWEEHERQFEAQKAKEREEQKMKEEKCQEEARKVKEQEVRDAQQARVRQAAMLQKPKIKEESEERKTVDQQRVYVKEETQDIIRSDDLNKLEKEELQLLKKMEKIKERRWRLQQEKEEREVESARKEQQARQAQKPGQQQKEEQTYTVTNTGRFNWW